MKKTRIKALNKIYLIFLIIVLLILLILTFQTGRGVYYLINTNLNDEKTKVKTDIANYYFNVRIEY